MPFISDADLDAALKDAGVTGATADAIVDENAQARIDGLRAALSVLAVLAVVALLFSGSLPTTPVGAQTRGRRRGTRSGRPRVARCDPATAAHSGG